MEQVHSNSPKTLTDIPKGPLTLIFKSLSAKDLSALRLVRNGWIHQTATKVLKDLKIRQLRPRFPRLIATLKANRKKFNLQILGALRVYTNSGLTAEERFKAVKDNKDVTTLVPMELLHSYISLESVSQKLIEAAQQNNPDTVLSELEKEGVWISAVDGSGRTALLWAVLHHALETAKLLLKNGADVNIADRHGNTPLHHASGKLRRSMGQGPEPEIAKLLLESGANVNLANRSGRTPLANVILSNGLKMAELLLKYDADVNLADEYGTTPLHLAVKYNNLKMVKLLFKYGADVKKVDSSGWTPLDEAIWERQMGKVILKEGTGGDTIYKISPRKEPRIISQEMVTLLRENGKKPPSIFQSVIAYLSEYTPRFNWFK